MKQYRTSVILAILAATGCVLMTVAARQLALQHLTDGVAQAPQQLFSAQQHLRYQFRALGILSSLAAFTFGWWLGIFLGKPLDILRADLIAGRSNGLPTEANAPSWSIEANQLRHAAQRFEAELVRRMNLLERGSADRTRLLNTVSEGLLQLDADSRILQANPAAIKLLGLPEDVSGKVLVSLVRNVELREIIATASGGTPIEGAEVTFDERRLLISAAPIPSPDGDTRRTNVLSIADLTQLRRLEGVRREFVANVSHELKTPLTSIHGYAETLRADDGLPVEMRLQVLDVINRNAVRLQHIVDDLLDLSRIESGVWNPTRQAVDVMTVVRDAWASCQDNAAAQLLHFDTPATSAFVLADPDALRQVFTNLFENAVRYTPEDGRITVRVAGDGDHGMDRRVSDTGGPSVLIEISDTGIGIPREALPRIFERFYRVDPARSRAAGGTGLGLAIVKHLVEGMGGGVSAQSEVGVGTTISLRLPAP
jgi:signal transduction histidine kinase